MNRRVLAAVTSLLLASAAGAAWVRTAAPAQVTFKAIMRPGGAFEGKTADLTVRETEQSITLVVPLQNLDTGMKLRNTHMKEKYLEVAKFPEASLEVSKAALKIPDAGKSGEGDAQGAFTLHGVKKDVKFHYKGSCDASNVCDVVGTFDINFNDYGVQVPSYLGVTVKPETSITAQFQVKRDAAPAPAPAPAPTK
jgi:polyisoprenoid-binding protein YceI